MVKCLVYSVRDPGSIPGLGRSPGEGNGNPLQYIVWKIPWTEEPGGLQSMGSQRVGHNRVTSLSLFTFMHWRQKWQPTPVFLPGESQGRWSLVGCLLWGRTESDMTERLRFMVFPVVMYGCESWTVKKAESQRIEAFELWCWRRLLRVP